MGKFMNNTRISNYLPTTCSYRAWYHEKRHSIMYEMQDIYMNMHLDGNILPASAHNFSMCASGSKYISVDLAPKYVHAAAVWTCSCRAWPAARSAAFYMISCCDIHKCISNEERWKIWRLSYDEHTNKNDYLYSKKYVLLKPKHNHTALFYIKAEGKNGECQTSIYLTITLSIYHSITLSIEPLRNQKRHHECCGCIESLSG